MKEITLKALTDNIDTVTNFVDDFLDENNCPMKTKLQIDIAIDEIFSNISLYAYEGSIGDATVQLEMLDNQKAVSITFIDAGVPYDPLKKEDPDTTLSAEEREIGGLGIFMVKKNMNEMNYSYFDNKNHLTLIKHF